MNRNWEEFLAPYHQAVAELKVKLKGMRTQFAMLTEHSPIEFVTGRVKSVASIIDKAEKRNVPLDRLREDMQDIAGLRMMCQFVDEIKPVVEYLRKRNDFEIVEERDYVTQRKIAAIALITLSLVTPFKRFREKKSIGRNPNTHVSNELLGNN